jgi:Arc/MetJ family transcription regulator
MMPTATPSAPNLVHYVRFICMSLGMRTTLKIDDDLLRSAQALCGVKEKAALVREGLKALIEGESARRVARLGGSEPQLEPIPRQSMF